METDVTNLDPKILKVMKALRSVESGDGKGSGANYKAVGDGGSSTGAFQWNNGKTPVKPGQIPVNFQSDAKTYGFDPTDFSPANQNKVMYHKIKAQKESGLGPEEIAALHNGASKDPTTGKYIYNNPDYGVKFRTALAGAKVNVPEQPNQDIKSILFGNYKAPEAYSGMTGTDEVTPAGLATQFAGSVYNPAAQIGMEAANRVVGPTVNALGGSYEQVKSLPSFENIVGDPNSPRVIAPSYDENGNPVSLGTEAEKTLGAAGMTALNVASLGKGKAVSEGLQGVGQYAIGKTGGPLTSVLKAGLREVPMGAGYGASSAMSQGEDVGNVGASTLAGGALGFAGGATLKGITNQIAKKQGITTKMFEDLDAAIQSGDDAQIKAITESPAYKKLISSNNYDAGAVDKSVGKVKTAIEDGINNSYGVAKLTRSEKAENLTDDGIKAMMEHVQNTDNPIADTKLALENKANDLMDTALNPVIDKVRNEKLALVPLDRKSLLDDFNSRLDKSYITDLDKEKIKDYVATLVNTQNKGNPFGIVDAGIIRRDANFDFTNPKNKGAVSRLLGNTMRDALDVAEKKATDPQTKAIISHINAVNKEYSRLMQGVDVVNLMARFPGQKASEILNKGAAFMTAGAAGGNPLAFMGAHALTNKAQKMLIRTKNNALFGDMSGKAGPITSSELIGNAQRILKNVAGVSEQRAAEEAAVTAGREAVQKKNSAVNKLLETITPKRDSQLPVIDMGPKAKSKYSKADKNLPNIAYGAAPFGVAGVIDKIKGLGKETYQREPEPVQQKPDNTPELVSQIANAETRGETDPYKTKKWSDRKLGPASPLGRDLGKYQITSARLREKSKEFLGKKVTDEEFLNSPELQDKFITEQVKWQKKNGLSDDEILATHRRGWGNMKPEQLKKAVATSSDYINKARSGK